MPDIVGVRFKKAGQLNYFDTAGIALKVGDQVVAETARGLELGTVVIPPRQTNETTEPLKPVLRLASAEDIGKVSQVDIHGQSSWHSDWFELRSTPFGRICIHPRAQPVEPCPSGLLEGNALSVELLLDPLMTVDAHVDGERDIGTDLDEGRAEILVLEVEVIVFDKNPLTEIVEVGESGVSPLLSLESVGLFLSHTDKDDPLRLIKLLPILGSDIILALSWVKMDYGDAVLGGERFNGSNESLGHTP